MSDWISRESRVHHAASGYLVWRASCAHVGYAYGLWRAAPLDECAFAHAAYLRALDDEERAAESYSRALTGGVRQAPWER
ncbi:hypothetical protein OM076_35695 [Solirubrobacter ginsenosidimutans]|uniref:Uncharacterized protein n=1 Tax=Solirubrobacter ginsenosidimutans TaxID=490573 RepID=A0A9X3MZ50_9ACTN|nr:hypothetical protein [Solirubrobacter ginsenosidimutans]